MIGFRPLSWEYGLRNLLRRPLRTGMTFAAMSTVILLVLLVVGFIRGLEASLAKSGNSQTALVLSLGMGENVEYSSIPTSTADLLAASIPNVQQRYGSKYVSGELYLGTQVEPRETDATALGLVRGVTPAALLVRGQVEIISGDWPGPGEVLVGRLAPTKLGLKRDAISIGDTMRFENRQWRVSGLFAAGGSVYESELWCRLDDLQEAMQRQDLSLVAMQLAPDGKFAELDLFCKRRLDLELQAVRESDYYAQLQSDYRPVRFLAWFVVLLVSGAGMFAGLNTMYASVVGRIRELATLQTIGFVRRAIVLSLVQEALLLAMAAALAASGVALLLVQGAAVRFTMGAFELEIDNVTVLVGCGTGFCLGLLGAIPPSIRALRVPVAQGLKSI